VRAGLFTVQLNTVIAFSVQVSTDNIQNSSCQYMSYNNTPNNTWLPSEIFTIRWHSELHSTLMNTIQRLAFRIHTNKLILRSHVTIRCAKADANRYKLRFRWIVKRRSYVSRSASIRSHAPHVAHTIRLEVQCCIIAVHKLPVFRTSSRFNRLVIFHLCILLIRNSLCTSNLFSCRASSKLLNYAGRIFYSGFI
jgi:hypothetical protein